MSQQVSLAVTWSALGDSDSDNGLLTKAISGSNGQRAQLTLAGGRQALSLALSFTAVLVRVTAAGTATTMTYDAASTTGGPLSVVPGDFAFICLPPGTGSFGLNPNGSITLDIRVW